jgi:DNA-directed RNA polymerase subunit L
MISEYQYDEYKLNFNINNISSGFLNSIRRGFLSLLPIITFDDNLSETIENNSFLSNELLLHRISLIPLNNYNFEITTSFNVDTGIREFFFDYKKYLNYFRLETNQSGTVFSKDIINIENKTDYILIEDIPVNKLSDNQSFKLHLIPSLGTGKVNGRFNPVSTLSIITEDDENFNCTIESIGFLKINNIFYNVLTVLKLFINDIKNEIEKILDDDDYKSNKVSISNDDYNFYIKISNENQTVGNIITEFLNKTEKFDFVGMEKPHPLLDFLNINLHLTEINNKCILKILPKKYHQNNNLIVSYTKYLLVLTFTDIDNFLESLLNQITEFSGVDQPTFTIIN